MRISFSILSLLFVFFSCGGSKKATETEESYSKRSTAIPEWVKVRPESDFYYVGIGKSSKKTSPADYREVAKKNALSDLVSGISVTISAQSVLSQVEINNSFKEEFHREIKMNSNDQIDKYDEVGVYENNDDYYVYFQLSKSDYQQKKQKEVDDVIAQGTDFLKKANDFKVQGRYKEALLSYVSGLEKIKAYLNQSLETQFEGKTIYLGNELFNGYRSTLNEIVIDADVETLRTKIGSKGKVFFTIKNLEGKALGGLPLAGEVKRQIYSYVQGVSDQSGVFSLDVEKVSKQNTEQYIKVGIDVKQICKEALAGSVISKMLSSIPSNIEKINIETQPVYVMIKSEENVNGVSLAQKMLEGAFKETFVSNGFIPVDVFEKADLIVEVKTNSVDAGVMRDQDMQFCSSTLNSVITLKEKASNNVIYQTSLNAIKGTQLSFEKAAEDAYIKASKKIKLSIVSEMISAYLK